MIARLQFGSGAVVNLGVSLMLVMDDLLLLKYRDQMEDLPPICIRWPGLASVSAKVAWARSSKWINPWHYVVLSTDGDLCDTIGAADGGLVLLRLKHRFPLRHSLRVPSGEEGKKLATYLLACFPP